MSLFSLALIDPQVLKSVNSLAGGNSSLDTAMRWTALFAAPALVAALVVKAWCADTWRARQAAWACSIGGALAVGAAIEIQQVFLRPRPFVYMPVHLLLCYPNDVSFPSLDMAAAGAAALGLFLAGGKARWLALLALLVAGFARMYCGIEYLSDIVAGWLLGMALAGAVVYLTRFEGSRAARLLKQAASAAFLLLCAAIAIAATRAVSKTAAPVSSYTPKATSPAEDNSIVKGYSPRQEAALAKALLKEDLPYKVLRVAIGKGEGPKVAGIKFEAGRGIWVIDRDSADRMALHIIRTTFQKTDIAEADVWGVVPFKTASGRIALKVVYSVSAERSKAEGLVSTKPVTMPAQKALMRFGWVYYRSALSGADL